MHAIENTWHEKDLGLYDGDDEGYLARIERLTQRKRELEALPSAPAGFEWRNVGETYRQAWKRMDSAQRRTLLIDSCIKFTVAGGPALKFHIYVPDDIRGRIERVLTGPFNVLSDTPEGRPEPAQTVT